MNKVNISMTTSQVDPFDGQMLSIRLEVLYPPFPSSVLKFKVLDIVSKQDLVGLVLGATAKRLTEDIPADGEDING